MSPVTSLLESLHSAMIDELTERHPEPKPGLGLPIRQPRFALPHPGVTRAMLCEVALPQAQALIVLAFSDAALGLLKVEPQVYWEHLLKRAGAEFMRREIRPRLGKVLDISGKSDLPMGVLNPGRLIWIPFSLGATGACFLGVGA